MKELHRVDKESPIVLMKAIKNDAELQGMRACHLRDGAAMAEFLSELESILYRNDESCAGVTEYDLDIMVTDCRAKAGLFLERSFPTIAGVNGNGAIIHYRFNMKQCDYIIHARFINLFTLPFAEQRKRLAKLSPRVICYCLILVHSTKMEPQVVLKLQHRFLLSFIISNLEFISDVTRTFHFGEPTDWQVNEFIGLSKTCS